MAGASAEILGAGPLLLQLSKYPQPVLAVMLLITAGSIIPVVKGSEGGYLQSLRETYTIPEGVFTESLVRPRCCCCCLLQLLATYCNYDVCGSASRLLQALCISHGEEGRGQGSDGCVAVGDRAVLVGSCGGCCLPLHHIEFVMYYRS